MAGELMCSDSMLPTLTCPDSVLLTPERSISTSPAVGVSRGGAGEGEGDDGQVRGVFTSVLVLRDGLKEKREGKRRSASTECTTTHPPMVGEEMVLIRACSSAEWCDVWLPCVGSRSAVSASPDPSFCVGVAVSSPTQVPPLPFCLSLLLPTPLPPSSTSPLTPSPPSLFTPLPLPPLSPLNTSPRQLKFWGLDISLATVSGAGMVRNFMIAVLKDANESFRRSRNRS